MTIRDLPTTLQTRYIWALTYGVKYCDVEGEIKTSLLQGLEGEDLESGIKKLQLIITHLKCHQLTHKPVLILNDIMEHVKGINTIEYTVTSNE